MKTNPTKEALIANLITHMRFRSALNQEPIANDDRWIYRFYNRAYDLIDRQSDLFDQHVRHHCRITK